MEPYFFVFAIFSIFAINYSNASTDNFAITDKVGQGNFAFAKLFAFNEDGNLYRLTKRSLQEPQNSFAFAINGVRNKFAKHRGNQDRDFAFAFAKRASPFAKRFAVIDDGNDEFPTENQQGFAKRVGDDNTFARFAKREKFAFAQKNNFA
uniref:Uncharacterized protein n=1 Tax=Panagrolaimus sp. JU765 TaxID=591449 RepID=A0AC34RIB8_9BILA